MEKTPYPSNMSEKSTLASWIDQHESEWLDDFFTFLRFQSISSESSFHTEVLQCHDWLVKYLEKIGCTVESWPTTGYPVIFASHLKAGPKKPTLLIYHHYDVQPVDPLEQWVTPPFQPSIRNGEIFARGAQDNKGQCFYVLQALRALQDIYGSFPINIKLCIEGEEEIGSAGLSKILLQKKEDLAADCVAIIDLGLRKAGTPSLTLGIRGIITLDVELTGSSFDLHSGAHGGIAYNPNHALVELLAKMRNEQGKITIPGFYDDVIPLTIEEKTTISFAFDKEEYRQQIGASPTGGEQDYSILERAWIRPTIEINGVYGGYSGEGFKTVIPAKAHAKISCRLVPNQNPDIIGQILTNYFKKQAPPGIDVAVKLHPGKGKAIRVGTHTSCTKAFARAFEEVFQKPCEYMYEGSSIPIAAKLGEIAGGETILLGLGLITDQVHAPNEHFGLDRLKQGTLVIARAIQILSENR